MSSAPLTIEEVKRHKLRPIDKTVYKLYDAGQANYVMELIYG